MTNIENNIIRLYKSWSGINPRKIIQMPNSGSSRIYYRIYADDLTVVAVFNDNQKENITFINFTKQFKESNINVPEILAEDLSNHIYIISDLGNTTLLEWLLHNRQNGAFPDKGIVLYKKVLTELARMQVVAGRNFDYTYSYPFKEFDKRAIIYDLKYFKCNFVSALRIDFNPEKLNDEFMRFADHLLSENADYFMFRDFQARNIMLVNDEPFFIDYQGGRKGALQYDLASLLFQAKAEIPQSIRIELLNYYMSVVEKYISLNKDNFVSYYYSFAFVRVLQTLGAYGLRGIVEQKAHFVESIPLAINNLKDLYNKIDILNDLSELKLILFKIFDLKTF
ncbi:MAG: phosphotransferase [Bacteroidales bacterium]|nr:phosphotransferase [Bacteroidales bacterium]